MKRHHIFFLSLLLTLSPSPTFSKDIVSEFFDSIEKAKTDENAKKLRQIQDARVSDVQIDQELEALFTYGSRHTNVQRENAENRLKGKVVLWTLEVYENARISHNYRLVLKHNALNIVATVIPSNAAEAKSIEALMTGDTITVKGMIEGIGGFRSIDLDPAIVLFDDNRTLHSNSTAEANQPNSSNIEEEIDGPAESESDDADTLRQMEEEKHRDGSNIVEKPEIKVGDSYEIRSSFASKGNKPNVITRTVSGIRNGEITVVARNWASGDERKLFFTDEWNLKKTIDKTGLTIVYEPPVEYFDFPLFVGKEWRKTTLVSNEKDGVTKEITLSGTVQRWEKIGSAVGSCDALRIEAKTHTLDKKNGNQVVAVDISWYCPRLKRSVRSVISTTDAMGSTDTQTIDVIESNVTTNTVR